jgi:hypothetical protein
MIRFLIVLILVVSGSAVAQNMHGLAISDSSFRAVEDSLERVELSGRHRPPKDFLKNDVAFGASLGSPGGINFVTEGYYDRTGLRAEVGGAPLILLNLLGAQGSICYVIRRSGNSLMEVTGTYFSTFISSFDDRQGYWVSGIGAGIGINAGGFFFEVTAGHTEPANGMYSTGLLHSSTINSWPMTFQVGYVH